MKVSEVTTQNIAEYLKLEYADLMVSEIAHLETLKSIAEKFITSYTGVTDLDLHDDFVIVIYLLCQDMHDNRSVYIDKNNLNKVYETILGFYCTNLI